MGTLTNENPTPLPAAGYRLTFFDGFDGAFVDRAAWPIFQWGWANNGAFQYSPVNVVAFDGSAKVVSQPGADGVWTSGAFSQGWNGQLYGRYEVRARFDPGQGLSGALLLWPTDDEGGHEIDLIENRNAEKTLNNITVHGNGGFESWEFSYDATQWHTYTVDWLPGELVFYLDGQEIHRTSNRVAAEPMSFGVLGHVNSQTDLWQGGPPNADSPGFHSIHVDWVRVSTPEGLWPGALPGTLYGTPEGGLRASTEAWTGTWVAGNFGEYARSGVRSLDGTAYAATWNAAQWNDQVTAAVMAPAAWQADYATRLLYGNFVEVQADLRAAGATAPAARSSRPWSRTSAPAAPPISC